MRQMPTFNYSAWTILSLCGVLLVTPMNISYAAHGSAIVLRPVQQVMPIAKSGQPYTFNLANSVTGGTKPYRCVSTSLGVGTLELTRACVITGKAPIVNSMQVTGPFTFKVTDSAKPPHSLLITGVNVVTKAETETSASQSANSAHVLALDISIFSSTGGGGTVSADSGKLVCGLDACHGSYAPNTEVTLTPHPNPGSVFTGWDPTLLISLASGVNLGAGVMPCEGDGPCTVHMNQAKAVMAGFEIDHGFDGTYEAQFAGQVTYGCTGCDPSAWTDSSGLNLNMQVTQGEISVYDNGWKDLNQKIPVTGALNLSFPLADFLNLFSGSASSPDCQIRLQFSKDPNYYKPLSTTAVSVGTLTCDSGGKLAWNDGGTGSGLQWWTFAGSVKLVEG